MFQLGKKQILTNETDFSKSFRFRNEFYSRITLQYAFKSQFVL